MAVNFELLRKVQKHIIEEPNRLYMQGWFRFKKEDEDKDEDDVERWPDMHYPECGTVGCIKGWAVILSNPGLTYSEYRQMINYSYPGDILGLSSIQENCLFYVECWLAGFYNKYLDCGTQHERATVTSLYIDWFIENINEIDTMAEAITNTYGEGESEDWQV